MKANEYKEHEIFETLSRLEMVVEAEKELLSSNIDIQNYIKLAINYLLNKLGRSHYRLIEKARFDEIYQNVNEASSILEQHSSNLEIVKMKLQNAVESVSKLPQVIEENADISPKIISEIESLYNNKIEILEEQIGKLQEHISEQEKLFDKQKSEINESLAQIEIQSTAKLENLSQRILEQSDIILDSFKNTNQSNIENANKYYQDYLKDGEEKKAKILTFTTNTRKEIETDKQKVKDILQLVSNDAITGSYDIESKHQRKQANMFRWISIAILAITCIFAMITFWATANITDPDNFNWSLFAAKVFTFILLSSVATYTARESSKHRNLDVNNRRIALELIALHPFIVDLNKDEKNEIIKDLANKYFGNVKHESDLKGESVGIRISDLNDFFKSRSKQ